MKKIMILVFTFWFLGCSSDDANKTPVNETTIVAQAAIVRDSNQTALGNMLQSSFGSMLILNSAGYMYKLNWNGQLAKNEIYYSELNCIGTPYVRYFDIDNFNQSNINDQSIYSKTIISDYLGNIYKLSGIEESGYITPVATTALSLRRDSFNCSSGLAGGKIIKLESTDRNSAGIPDTITPPLTIEF